MSHPSDICKTSNVSRSEEPQKTNELENEEAGSVLSGNEHQSTPDAPTDSTTVKEEEKNYNDYFNDLSESFKSDCFLGDRDLSNFCELAEKHLSFYSSKIIEIRNRVPLWITPITAVLCAFGVLVKESINPFFSFFRMPCSRPCGDWIVAFGSLAILVAIGILFFCCFRYLYKAEKVVDAPTIHKIIDFIPALSSRSKVKEDRGKLLIALKNKYGEIFDIPDDTVVEDEFYSFRDFRCRYITESAVAELGIRQTVNNRNKMYQGAIKCFLWIIILFFGAIPLVSVLKNNSEITPLYQKETPSQVRLEAVQTKAVEDFPKTGEMMISTAAGKSPEKTRKL